jgi:hypothetical protein
MHNYRNDLATANHDMNERNAENSQLKELID